MPYNVTLIPGDGTGPEVVEATRRVLEATGLQFSWDRQEAGEAAIAKYGTPFPDQVLASVQRNGVALKGPVTTPVGTGFRSVNVALRLALDLYVNLRPAKIYPGVRTRYDNIDLVVVRENTEDLYTGVEFEEGTPAAGKLIDYIAQLNGKRIKPDSGISIKMISVSGSRRIVEWAFQYARSMGRRHVTAVHKANIMKFTDGLFLHVARQVAEEYSDIAFDDRIVDNLSMQLVHRPEQFDVLVLPNLYGDIVSDLCAGLIGGLGVAPGANIGDRCAVFEPVHGSSPQHAGLNKVNPMATMLSGVMMLRYLGELQAAARMESAVATVVAKGEDVTYDLKPAEKRDAAVGTAQMADAVIKQMLAS